MGQCNKLVPDDLKAIADEFNAELDKTFNLTSYFDYDGATFAKNFQLQYGLDMFLKLGLPLAEPVNIDSSSDLYREELEIDDFPEYGRWKVAHRDVIACIRDATKVSVINMGSPGQRGNYLSIVGPTIESVKWAVAELKFVLQQAAPAPASLPASSTQPPIYN